MIFERKQKTEENRLIPEAFPLEIVQAVNFGNVDNVRFTKKVK